MEQKLQHSGCWDLVFKPPSMEPWCSLKMCGGAGVKGLEQQMLDFFFLGVIILNYENIIPTQMGYKPNINPGRPHCRDLGCQVNTQPCAGLGGQSLLSSPVKCTLRMQGKSLPKTDDKCGMQVITTEYFHNHNKVH